MSPVRQIVVLILTIIGLVIFVITKLVSQGNELEPETLKPSTEEIVEVANSNTVNPIPEPVNEAPIAESVTESQASHLTNEPTITNSSTATVSTTKSIIKDETRVSPEVVKTPINIIATSSLSDATSTIYKEYIRKLINFEVTWEELAKQSVNDDDVFELADLDQDDLVKMLGYRQTPYSSANGYKITGPKSSAKAEFFIFASMTEDVDLYMFDDAGKFSGIIQFGEDGLGFKIEQIRGISIYTYGDMGFMFSGGIGTTTMFLNVKKPTAAQFYTRFGNEAVKDYFFPASTQTRGSVSVARTETSIEILNWNIDVDGDGVTDVSFGHEGPDEKTIEKMVDIVINDGDLPDSERQLFITAGQTGNY